MSKKSSIPPSIPLPKIPKLSKKKMKNLKNYKLSEEKKAYIHEKYEKPLQKRERKLKKKKRSDWWKNNAINVATLIVGILTLVATIVLGLLTLFH